MKSKCEHKWEFIAESSYSYNEWCELCGAWKRNDLEKGTTKIIFPEK